MRGCANLIAFQSDFTGQHALTASSLTRHAFSNMRLGLWILEQAFNAGCIASLTLYAIHFLLTCSSLAYSMYVAYPQFCDVPELIYIFSRIYELSDIILEVWPMTRTVFETNIFILDKLISEHPRSVEIAHKRYALVPPNLKNCDHHANLQRPKMLYRESSEQGCYSLQTTPENISNQSHQSIFRQSTQALQALQNTHPRLATALVESASLLPYQSNPDSQRMRAASGFHDSSAGENRLLKMHATQQLMVTAATAAAALASGFYDSRKSDVADSGTSYKSNTSQSQSPSLGMQHQSFVEQQQQQNRHHTHANHLNLPSTPTQQAADVSAAAVAVAAQGINCGNLTGFQGIFGVPVSAGYPQHSLLQNQGAGSSKTVVSMHESMPSVLSSYNSFSSEVDEAMSSSCIDLQQQMAIQQQQSQHPAMKDITVEGSSGGRSSSGNVKAGQQLTDFLVAAAAASVGSNSISMQYSVSGVPQSSLQPLLSTPPMPSAGQPGIMQQFPGILSHGIKSMVSSSGLQNSDSQQTRATNGNENYVFIQQQQQQSQQHHSVDSSASAIGATLAQKKTGSLFTPSGSGGGIQGQSSINGSNANTVGASNSDLAGNMSGSYGFDSGLNMKSFRDISCAAVAAQENSVNIDASGGEDTQFCENENVSLLAAEAAKLSSPSFSSSSLSPSLKSGNENNIKADNRHQSSTTSEKFGDDSNVSEVSSLVARDQRKSISGSVLPDYIKGKVCSSTTAWGRLIPLTGSNTSGSRRVHLSLLMEQPPLLRETSASANSVNSVPASALELNILNSCQQLQQLRNFNHDQSVSQFHIDSARYTGAAEFSSIKTSSSMGSTSSESDSAFENASVMCSTASANSIGGGDHNGDGITREIHVSQVRGMHPATSLLTFCKADDLLDKKNSQAASSSSASGSLNNVTNCDQGSPDENACPDFTDSIFLAEGGLCRISSDDKSNVMMDVTFRESLTTADSTITETKALINEFLGSSDTGICETRTSSCDEPSCSLDT